MYSLKVNDKMYTQVSIIFRKSITDTFESPCMAISDGNLTSPWEEHHYPKVCV